MTTSKEIQKDAETPSERFERVMRKAKARGQRARDRRVDSRSRTDATSTRRSPKGAA